MIKHKLTLFRARMAQIKENLSGVALIEFALALPLMMIVIFYGLEVTWLSINQLKLSQVALNAADNASRMGETHPSVSEKQLDESDILGVFQAADSFAKNMELFQRGRMNMYSIQADSKGVPYSAWSRCKGKLRGNPQIGDSNPLADGVGPDGSKVKPTTDTPIMYVEVFYQYKPLMGNMFMDEVILKQTATYTVRDKRVNGKAPTNPGSKQEYNYCYKYNDNLYSKNDAYQ